MPPLQGRMVAAGGTGTRGFFYSLGLWPGPGRRQRSQLEFPQLPAMTISTAASGPGRARGPSCDDLFAGSVCRIIGSRTRRRTKRRVGLMFQWKLPQSSYIRIKFLYPSPTVIHCIKSAQVVVANLKLDGLGQ